MMKFCFPERDPDTIDMDSEDLEFCNRKSSKSKDTNFYVDITNQYQKDVEKMKVCYFFKFFEKSSIFGIFLGTS